MKVVKTERGFEVLEHPAYPTTGQSVRVAQQSSAIGPYGDAFDRPGTSYLWLGDHHHLGREDVAELVRHLNNWLETGKLSGEKE